MKFVKKKLEILARLILKFPIPIFIISCILLFASVYFAQRLRVDPSFKALLNKEHPVVKILDESNKIFSHKDVAIVVVRSNSFKEGKLFVQTSAEALQKHPELQEVDYKLANNFFTKNMLLYLEKNDIRKIYSRLKKKINYEKKKHRIGLLLDDFVDDDPGLTYQDILDKYKGKSSINFSNLKNNFFYRQKKLKDTKKIEHIFIIIIKPKKSALDLDYASNIMSDISQIMKKSRINFSGIQNIEFTGRYQKKPEAIHNIINNFKRVTLIAGFGVLLILFIFFRSFWPILLIASGLIYGIFLTLGITQIFIGNLSLISTFLVAILLGLGIDFGIHILLRYKEERDAGKKVSEAFLLMYTETCLASTMAAVTTSFAFGTLMFSNFIGFSDFGFIGCIGILCILFSYMTLMPSMLLILTHYLKIRIIIHPMKFYLPSVIWTKVRISLCICSLLTLISILVLPKLQFNYDFSRVLGDKNLPSYLLDKEINSLFGKSFQVPSLLIVDNLKEEKRILEYLKQEKGRSRLIGLSLGLSSFIPEGQKNKLSIIRNIKKLIDKNQKYFKEMDSKQIKQLYRFRKSLDPNEFKLSQLPRYIKNSFKTKLPNETRRMIFIYSDINSENGKEIIQFSDYIDKLKINFKSVQVASQSLIFSEILKIILNEGKNILIIVLLSIFLMVVINLQSFLKGLLILVLLMLGLLWMLGLQATLGIKSDFINVIIYLIILGTSIDAMIHLYHRFENSKDLYLSMRNTGEAITLSSLTTIVGFGALIFGRTEAIVDLGLLAIVGVITNYLVCVLVLPMILQLKKSKV